MKVTKRPKRVHVKYRKIISHAATYVCPSCHTVFWGTGPNKNVTRFKCTCGQELIVSKKEV